MRTTVLPLSDHYRAAIRVSLRQQIPCAILCLLMLDGGAWVGSVPPACSAFGQARRC